MSEAFGAADAALPGEGEVYAASRALVREAVALHMTLGTAESCTGGLVAGAITAVPGSSDALLGGVVSYACSVKHDVLGVSQETLDTVGAVSGDCASQMADGARRVLGCDVAVSVTGIAGPGGAEPGKPVGTVWFGLSSRAGTSATLRTFSGDRTQVRAGAVMTALALLRGALAEEGS